MQGVVIYGVGSPVVVDIESSLERAGVRVVAAVRNVPGAVHLLDRTTLMETAEVTPEVRSYPFVVPLFTPANRHRGRAASRAGTAWAASGPMSASCIGHLRATWIVSCGAQDLPIFLWSSRRSSSS